jgi:hypothetical protein
MVMNPIRSLTQHANRLPVIRELLGRTQRSWWQFATWWRQVMTRDTSRRDYAFWDRARMCRARGLELSGLFLKPLASKTAAWVQGTVPRWQVDNGRSQEALRGWWGQHHAAIVRGYEDSVGLGDAFLVVNPDLSVTVLPPDVVTPIVDEDDYSSIIGWTVREVHPHPEHPTNRMAIEDRYTEEERVRTVWRDGVLLRTERYSNLIGRVPVVHVPNNPGVNSVFGEPEAVALLPVLQEYGEILAKALTGNKHQSLPTPVAQFQTVQDMADFWEKAEEIGLIETTTVTHPDGTTETYNTVNFDSEKFLTIAGGTFDYKYPGSFAKDTETLLGLLFYLILQHTEIPEFAWGNAIASSKASAESQLTPFVKWIEKKRAACTGWMLELARVVLAYTSVMERGVTADADISIGWEPLTDADGALTLNTLKWLLVEGLIDEETAVRLAPVDIENPLAVLRRAQAEREERQMQDMPPEDVDRQQFLDDEAAAQDAADELERAA